MNKLILIILSLAIFPMVAFASMTNGTIQNSYAWGENAGFVNFAPADGNVYVTDAGLSGYAWDGNYGFINLSPTDAGVMNDGKGNLSGQAWSAGGGWIDFSGVVINSSGKFTGTANGTTYGRLTFDCDQCNVTTDWRPASMRPSNFIPGGRSGVTSGISNIISTITSYFFPTPTRAVGTPTSDVGAASISTTTTTSVSNAQPINVSSAQNGKGNQIVSTTSQKQTQNKTSISNVFKMPIWEFITIGITIILLILVLLRFVF